ncbi:MAG: phosphoribosylaminoimidazolesuccinocarboxamide synthase [Pseudomonadota bacterium]
MKKNEKLYEGKAKIVYSTDDPNLLVIHFKDDATAFNGLKKGTIENKGKVNCQITALIYEKLEKAGISTHFVKLNADDELLVKRSEIVPVEVVLRNKVAGSLAKRLGLKEGTALKRTILEWYYKSDELGDPMINEDHIRAFEFATEDEIASIKKTSFVINDWLINFFKGIGIELIDYKLEYGRHKGKLVLADEITPDGCRLWDLATGEKLDKDRFRRDLGGVEEAYNRVHELISASI